MASFWPIGTAQIIRIVSYPIRKKSRFWHFYMWSSLSIRRFWGKRGKMEAKKGESWRRETPDTDAFTGTLHPHTAWFDTIQSKSHPVIGLSASRVKKLAKINLTTRSGRALVPVLLLFRFFWNLQWGVFESFSWKTCRFWTCFITCVRNCASVRSPTLCL